MQINSGFQRVHDWTFPKIQKLRRKEGSIIFAHPLKKHISGREIVAEARQHERDKHIVFLPRGLMESLCADDKYAAELLASDGSRPH